MDKEERLIAEMIAMFNALGMFMAIREHGHEEEKNGPDPFDSDVEYRVYLAFSNFYNSELNKKYKIVTQDEQHGNLIFDFREIEDGSELSRDLNFSSGRLCGDTLELVNKIINIKK